MKTVLVVDNEPFNVDLVSTILSKGGFNVVSAASGAEAIRKARRLHPAVILMDLHLPGMDGFETTKKLLSDPKVGETKVIAFSALAETEGAARAQKAGCSGYITKPVGARQLIDAINIHIAGKRKTSV